VTIKKGTIMPTKYGFQTDDEYQARKERMQAREDDERAALNAKAEEVDGVVREILMDFAHGKGNESNVIRVARMDDVYTGKTVEWLVRGNSRASGRSSSAYVEYFQTSPEDSFKFRSRTYGDSLEAFDDSHLKHALRQSTGVEVLEHWNIV
jgi:hypothetical protein